MVKKSVITRLVLLLFATLFVSSCASKDADYQKESSQVLLGRSTQEQIGDLYYASKGDVDALARMLNTSSSCLKDVMHGDQCPSEGLMYSVKSLMSEFCSDECNRNFLKLRYKRGDISGIGYFFSRGWQIFVLIVLFPFTHWWILLIIGGVVAAGLLGDGFDFF